MTVLDRKGIKPSQSGESLWKIDKSFPNEIIYIFRYRGRIFVSYYFARARKSQKKTEQILDDESSELFPSSRPAPRYVVTTLSVFFAFGSKLPNFPPFIAVFFFVFVFFPNFSIYFFCKKLIKNYFATL